MKLPVESILFLNGFLFLVGLIALGTAGLPNVACVLMLVVGGVSVRASLQLLRERESASGQERPNGQI